MENIKIIRPASTHEHWVGFTLENLDKWSRKLFLFWVKNHNKEKIMLFHMYILRKGGSESYLGTLSWYYLLRLTWNGRWGARRTHCNSYSRMFGKQFALSPVSPLFKCLHRLTSIKKLALAHSTKEILQSNWGNAIQAGRPFGVADDVALFSRLQTSPWVWRLKAWVPVCSIEYIQWRKPGV